MVLRLLMEYHVLYAVGKVSVCVICSVGIIVNETFCKIYDTVYFNEYLQEYIEIIKFQFNIDPEKTDNSSLFKL